MFLNKFEMKIFFQQWSQSCTVGHEEWNIHGYGDFHGAVELERQVKCLVVHGH
jgi:hypothetical protein